MEEHKTSLKSADSSLRMIDVCETQVTRRRALARGRIRMRASSAQRILEKSLPKGNVISLSETAGILAAKKTPELLPLCHGIALDAVRVVCEPKLISANEGAVDVTCEVICHGKTGVEMEALMGTSAAILCIYDLVKGIDEDLIIEEIYLDTKEGGKSGIWRHAKVTSGEQIKTETTSLAGLRAFVLTVSDRGLLDSSYDKTGPLICDFLTSRRASAVEASVVGDEEEGIKKKVLYWVKELKADVVVITGGTGIGPRDVTPEALEKLWSKKLDGFGEALRRKGSYSTKHAWLSRAVAGTIDQTVVIALPGSQGAVGDALEILDSSLSHMVSIAKGARH